MKKKRFLTLNNLLFYFWAAVFSPFLITCSIHEVASHEVRLPQSSISKSSNTMYCKQCLAPIYSGPVLGYAFIYSLQIRFSCFSERRNAAWVSCTERCPVPNNISTSIRKILCVPTFWAKQMPFGLNDPLRKHQNSFFFTTALPSCEVNPIIAAV